MIVLFRRRGDGGDHRCGRIAAQSILEQSRQFAIPEKRSFSRSNSAERTDMERMPCLVFSFCREH